MIPGRTTIVLVTRMVVSVAANQTSMVSTVTDVNQVSLISPTLAAKVGLW